MPLEHTLNDFAVIRVTSETLDYFPDDADMRDELMEIVAEARRSLCRRLAAFIDMDGEFYGEGSGKNLEDFQRYLIEIMERGIPGKQTNTMMKLNSFDESAVFRYTFRDNLTPDQARFLPPVIFVRRLFADLLSEAEDDDNYISAVHFNTRVFQKYITIMFCNYATTDPLFYNKP
jgi:hypothetical protein